MKQVDPKLLQVFVDVVRQGSFVNAANLRETDSSYVSRQIQKLEASLNVRLLNRSTRAISLTEKGLEIYQHAEKMNDIVQDIVSVAERDSVSLASKVRITSSIYLGKKFLMPIVDQLCSNYPSMQVDVNLSDEQVDLIKENYDLALRVWTPKSVDLIATDLLDIRFMLVANSSFVDLYGVPESIEELSKLPAIAYRRKGHNNKVVSYKEDDGQLNTYHLNANLCVNDDSEVEKYGLLGQRYFLATNYMAAKQVREGKLIQLLPNLELPLDAKVSVLRPNRSLSMAAQLIIDELQRALAEYE